MMERGIKLEIEELEERIAPGIMIVTPRSLSADSPSQGNADQHFHTFYGKFSNGDSVPAGIFHRAQVMSAEVDGSSLDFKVTNVISLPGGKIPI